MQASDRTSPPSPATGTGMVQEIGVPPTLSLKSKHEQQKHTAVVSRSSRPRRSVSKNAASVRNHMPPRQQLTAKQLLAIARRLAESSTTHTAAFDHAFAEAVVSQLAEVYINLPGRRFYPADALRNTCDILGLTHYPAYSKHDVDRFIDTNALGTRNEMKMPFIWLNNVNAYGIDVIRTGSHGFAWMFSVDSANLDLVHAFHLLNCPGPADQWNQRKWSYCGKYYAHRTGYYMSVDGWKQLPRAVSFSLCVACQSG
ncbi:hypothetical protein C8T65DRAFT_657569 [Cerioporus squamosus]|nr:hypothetical protein C8T65DRAFT_657569 [Cerioporus squamosus]